MKSSEVLNIMVDYQEFDRSGNFYHKTTEKSDFLTLLKDYDFSIRDMRMILKLAEITKTRQPTLVLRPSSKSFVFDVENIQLLCLSDKCLIFNPENKSTKNFIQGLHQKFSGTDSDSFRNFSEIKVLKLLKQDSNQQYYEHFENVVLETALGKPSKY